MDDHLVEADGDGLAEVHRGLVSVGGDFDHGVAKGQIVAREAMLFRAEDDGDASRGSQLLIDECGQMRQGEDGLFGLAGGAGAGSENQGGLCAGLGKAFGKAGFGKELGGTDGRSCFAPVRRVGSNDGQASESKVGHGSRRGPNVEGVAGADKDDFEGIALELVEQDLIVRGEAGEGGRSSKVSACRTARGFSRVFRVVLGRKADNKGMGWSASALLWCSVAGAGGFIAWNACRDEL